MHDGEDFPFAARDQALLDHTQYHHVDDHGFLRNIVGREDFHLFLVRESRSQRAKSRIDQDGVIDDSNSIFLTFWTFARGGLWTFVMIFRMLCADGDAHKTTKRVVCRAWLLIKIKWPVNLAHVVDVRF